MARSIEILGLNGEVLGQIEKKKKVKANDSSDPSGLKPGTLRHQVWELVQDNIDLSSQLAERDETIESCLWLLALPEIRAILLTKRDSDSEAAKIIAQVEGIMGEEDGR